MAMKYALVGFAGLSFGLALAYYGYWESINEFKAAKVRSDNAVAITCKAWEDGAIIHNRDTIIAFTNLCVRGK